MVEASIRKGPFNAWVVEVLKGPTRAIRCSYRVGDIDRGYRLEIDRWSKKQALKAKSKMPRALKSRISRK